MLATASCTLACLFNYWHPVGKVLWLPLRWNALYLVLNAYYAGRLLSKRFVTLTPEEDHIYKNLFSSSMVPADFKRLASLGVIRDVGGDEELEVIRMGQPNDRLIMLLSGVGVIVLDQGVRLERRSGLFGEVSFLHGQPASATVRLQPGSRYMVWSRGETRDGLAEEAKRGLEHAISLEVTRHLSATSSRIVALAHPAEEVRKSTWQEVQVARLRRDGSVSVSVTSSNTIEPSS